MERNRLIRTCDNSLFDYSTFSNMISLEHYSQNNEKGRYDVMGKDSWKLLPEGVFVWIALGHFHPHIRENRANPKWPASEMSQKVSAKGLSQRHSSKSHRKDSANSIFFITLESLILREAGKVCRVWHWSSFEDSMLGSWSSGHIGDLITLGRHFAGQGIPRSGLQLSTRTKRR